MQYLCSANAGWVFWMSHKFADRSIERLLVITLALLVACLFSWPVSAKEPPARSAVYPSAGDPDLINSLQIALFDNGCYGNRLVRDGPTGEVDGQFERKSRKAIWVFIDTINDTVAGAQKFKASDLTARAILSAIAATSSKSCPCSTNSDTNSRSRLQRPRRSQTFIFSSSCRSRFALISSVVGSSICGMRCLL